MIKAILPLLDKFGLRRIAEIKYSSTAGIERVINEILENPNVEYTELSYVDDEEGCVLEIKTGDKTYKAKKIIVQ